MLNDGKIKLLEEKARAIRRLVINMLVEARSGHTASPLGTADILALLYFHTLKHDPKRPDWNERDIFVLSSGHICPVLYAAMSLAGYLPEKELSTLRRFGSRLQGHPHREWLPGLETSSGPLGSGLAQAVGMALGLRLDNLHTSRHVFCLLSDAEMECGATWEAAMLAGKEKLHNLIAIVDRNMIQIGGLTEEVMPLEPVIDKWKAFGWQVIEVDGHNFSDLDDAIGLAKAAWYKPAVIIAHTIPGKGVTAFEGRYEWHGKVPSKEEGRVALDNLAK
ncbi:MAG: Transketolase domain protein [Parcubacteria group bacterium GW2011_GWC1_43_11b]|uniref:Transketolase n=2 Tax=Candidatus Vogeliibacteriota TaxID=1817922 RepID=A0A1G2QEZ5_9BACT|nr:MAG: Transketolase domain protein [Parcubacteria group bacterium GW2011_GWB1_42_9]KKS88241.1 MAG: Transketolase domain protein [Parcubacteria group bacterium GW2011_GWC1_43_11b]OHA59170.1 MAG: transketolase [Candidatus Vogelbacteria bacterium RIFOXYB1_FULL_42_16]OHA60299.1 MAG: transketolase [Candidatus Vogelbacteria bacterium RIFOXYD1_FULL_42_15]